METKEEEIEWGDWGDDKEQEPAGQQSASAAPSTTKPESLKTKETSSPKQLKQNQPALSVNTKNTPSHLHLIPEKEFLSITSMPAAILNIVTQILSDSAQLSTDPILSTSPIAPAAPDLLNLPTLVLATYRALAPIYYSSDISSKMYLSNDLTFITNEKNKLQDTTPIEIDMEPLTSLSKQVYNKELENQRTILLDYLDMTQGFAACMTYPQNEECERQVESVIHLLKICHEKWKTVRGKTQLFTCLGSLLTTTAEKIINNILDMSDIPEEESRQLSSLMGKLANEIGPLFILVPEGEGKENIPQTAVYTSNWLRFRYLEQVLECSLVDLMYLYNEESLSVEFEKEELIDLVKALFADTESRRKCLEAIRRGPMAGPTS